MSKIIIILCRSGIEITRENVKENLLGWTLKNLIALLLLKVEELTGVNCASAIILPGSL
jgi:hypothetical protein